MQWRRTSGNEVRRHSAQILPSKSDAKCRKRRVTDQSHQRAGAETVTERTNMLAARCGIYLLADDRDPAGEVERESFDDAPFRISSPSVLLPARPRIVEDADVWALWRLHRLDLEQKLASQESCRTVDPDEADRLRDRLVEIERRVCDTRVEDILGELTQLERQVRNDAADA